MSATPYVAVVGAGAAGPDEAEAAAQVGRLLAEAGAVVVCGGLGGVMEAAARGAAGAGGTTVGLLPGTDRTAGNPYLTVTVATGLGELRNGLVVRTSDALIAVGGEYGTLSEVAFALKLGVPVIGLGTWELARGGQPDQAIVRATTPAEAVRAAMGAAAR